MGIMPGGVRSIPPDGCNRVTNMYVHNGKLIFEYDAGNMAIQSLTLDPGAQNLEDQSIPVRNETGGSLDEGDLVYLSGWDEATGRWLIDLAHAKAHKGVLAQFILRTSLADVTNGDAHRSHRLAGLDTSGQTVGDEVYLSDDVAGSYVFSLPKHAQHQVGRVAIVDGVIGEIEFLILPSTDSDLVRSQPQSGENPIRGMRRKNNGKIEVDYDDVAVV